MVTKLKSSDIYTSRDLYQYLEMASSCRRVQILDINIRVLRRSILWPFQFIQKLISSLTSSKSCFCSASLRTLSFPDRTVATLGKLSSVEIRVERVVVVTGLYVFHAMTHYPRISKHTGLKSGLPWHLTAVASGIICPSSS